MATAKATAADSRHWQRDRT